MKWREEISPGDWHLSWKWEYTVFGHTVGERMSFTTLGRRCSCSIRPIVALGGSVAVKRHIGTLAHRNGRESNHRNGNVVCILMFNR